MKFAFSLILLIVFNTNKLFAQQNIDTINCKLAFRIDTGKFGFFYRCDDGDQVYHETKYLLIKDWKFTDTGFIIASDSLVLKNIIQENRFILFSKQYKNKRIKRGKKLIKNDKFFNNFDGFEFYIFNVTMVINKYRTTNDDYYIWPSNNKNLTYVKRGGTIAEIIKVIEIKPIQINYKNWKLMSPL